MIFFFSPERQARGLSKELKASLDSIVSSRPAWARPKYCCFFFQTTSGFSLGKAARTVNLQLPCEALESACFR